MKINGEKLQYFRKRKNISQEELGKKLGGLIKQNISLWENDMKEVPPKYHQKLCEILGITLDEIIDNIPTKVHEPPASYNAIPEGCEPVPSARIVPVLSIAHAAMFDPCLEPIDDYAKGCADEYREFSLAKPGYFAVRIEGDSMFPEIKDGDVVLVAGGEFPQRGDFVVAKLRTGELVCKEYHRKDNVITLVSLNNGGKEYSWNCKEQPGCYWMYPVIQVMSEPRRRRWNKHKNGNGEYEVL